MSTNNKDLFRLPAGPAEICFDKNEFMKKTFSVDAFLQEHRNAATLETMRDDLGIYLKVLRSAMIELINEDYADFVNLSSNLVGLDQSIQGIQLPLNSLKDEIVAVRTTLESTMQDVNECLEQKRELREHLKSVQCLMSARNSMEKMTKLLTDQLSNDDELNPLVLERAAMELVKLKYDLQFCHEHINRLENPSALNKYEEIHGNILEKVEKHFLKVLNDRKLDELERCLRVYCTLGEYRAAEEIFRKKVIGPHMHPIISEVSLQNAPQGLNGIYNQIIQFLNDQMRQLLLLTQSSDSTTASVQGFNFIINSFWIEIENRIETHMTSIFAPGNPESFYQKYEYTIVFLEKVENAIKNRQQIEEFHDHVQYKQFQSKWNLPVYFQIRFQEIGGTLESACSEAINEDLIITSNSEYHLKPFTQAYSCILKCWMHGVYLQQLFTRFLKLTLQILSRLGKWSNEIIETKGQFTKLNRIDFLILLYLDVLKLKSKISSIFDCIVEKIPINLNTQLNLIEKSFDGSQEIFSKYLKRIEQQWNNEIIAQTSGWAKQVADIPRLYRKTNREAPTKPCNYVEQILKPSELFWNKNSERIEPKTLKECLTSSLSQLNRQYFSAVNDVLTSVQKTEESLRRLKNLRERSGTANPGNIPSSGMSDDDKIRLQLYVDITSWCEGIEKLGINRKSIDKLDELVQLVDGFSKIKSFEK